VVCGWAFFSNFSLILRGVVRKRKEKKNSKDEVSLTIASFSVHQQTHRIFPRSKKRDVVLLLTKTGQLGGI
jgi:hypothetical protein